MSQRHLKHGAEHSELGRNGQSGGEVHRQVPEDVPGGAEHVTAAQVLQPGMEDEAGGGGRQRQGGSVESEHREDCFRG